MNLLSKDDENINKRGIGDGIGNNTYSAALRYFLLEQSKWKLSTDMGMRIDVPLDPFVKLRLKRVFKIFKHEISLIQKFSYYRVDEFSESSDLIWTKEVGGGDKLKLQTNLGWSEKSPTFSGSNTVSYLQKLSKKRAISYSIGAFFIIDTSYYYDRYQIASNYRQLVFKDWIFGQAAIGTIFRKEDDFNSSEYVSIAIDMIF